MKKTTKQKKTARTIREAPKQQEKTISERNTGFFKKKKHDNSAGSQKRITEDEKSQIFGAAKKIEMFCKKSAGYCFECPIAKFTQMCTVTPQKWNIKN